MADGETRGLTARVAVDLAAHDCYVGLLWRGMEGASLRRVDLAGEIWREFQMMWRNRSRRLLLIVVLEMVERYR